MVNKELIKRFAKLELARRSFWDYCKVKAPDFYKKGRWFLEHMCNNMQDFIESSKEDILVINVPPR